MYQLVNSNLDYLCIGNLRDLTRALLRCSALGCAWTLSTLPLRFLNGLVLCERAPTTSCTTGSGFMDACLVDLWVHSTRTTLTSAIGLRLYAMALLVLFKYLVKCDSRQFSQTIMGRTLWSPRVVREVARRCKKRRRKKAR